MTPSPRGITRRCSRKSSLPIAQHVALNTPLETLNLSLNASRTDAASQSSLVPLLASYQVTHSQDDSIRHQLSTIHFRRLVTSD